MTPLQAVKSKNKYADIRWENCPDCGALVRQVGSILSITGHRDNCSLKGQDPNTFSPDSKTGRKLFKYQQEGVDWICSLEKEKDKPFYFGLFWQMRLGKTITVIKIAKRKNFKKVLIVCPKSVIPTWVKELKYEEVVGIPIDTKAGRILENFYNEVSEGWFITNYEALLRISLDTTKWELVILDESHKIKDPGTKISKLITKSFQNCEAKAALSGTPAPENVLNYFQTLKFLKGEFCGLDTFWKFRDRFFWGNGRGGYEPKYGMDHVLVEHMSSFCSVLQREHAGIGGKTLFEQRFVEMEGEYKEYYDELEKNWCNKDYEAQWAIQVFQQLHQLSGGYPKIHDAYNPPQTSDHKLKELKSLLKTELVGEQVVIWARYRRELIEAEKVTNKFGYTRIINGDTPIDTRQRYMDMLNNKRIRYLCCQIKTGSLGVDLSGADTAIVLSNELGVSSRLQLVDRLIHPEKKTPNLIIDITTKNTVDEDIYDLLQAKVDKQQEFLMKIYQKARERNG